MSYSDSVNGTMFSSFPAFQWYKVRLYMIDIHGVHFCYETGIYTGTFRYDARFLHNQTADSSSVNGTLLSSFPATQQCKIPPCVIDIQYAELPGTFRLHTRSLHNQM